MDILNIEFKARVRDILKLERKLAILEPIFIGEDHQIDTYFTVPEGRVKLREGNVENSLIYYKRENLKKARTSKVILYKCESNPALKKILIKMANIKVVVDKVRKIYFVENVKFHFDNVVGLGQFVEVEAIDKSGTIGIKKLQKQCDYYFDFFDIKTEDFIAESYSDMVL